MDIPTTVTQVAILLVAVVPGVVYRAVRVRVTGKNPGDSTLAHRVLRAFVASVVFVSIYALIFGDAFLDIARVPIAGAPTEVAVAVLIGGVALPAVAGAAVNAVTRSLRHARNSLYAISFDRGSKKEKALRTVAWVDQNVLGTVDELTPWDARISTLAPCYVRVRRVDGTFLMGYLDAGGYVSTYPDEPAIFMSVQVDVDEFGRPGDFSAGTKGLWYQLMQGDIVEFVAVSDEGSAAPELAGVEESSHGREA